MKSKKIKSGYKRLQCKYCDNICDKVDDRADKITCWFCTQKLVDGYILRERPESLYNS